MPIKAIRLVVLALIGCAGAVVVRGFRRWSLAPQFLLFGSSALDIERFRTLVEDALGLAFRGR